MSEEERDRVVHQAHVDWGRLGGTASQDAREAAGLPRGTFLPRGMTVPMAVKLLYDDPDLLKKLVSKGCMIGGRQGGTLEPGRRGVGEVRGLMWGRLAGL